MTIDKSGQIRYFQSSQEIDEEEIRLYVYVSPIPPSVSVTRNRIPTAPLLPIYPGPHPVHEVCTSHTRRATPASRPYTSNATPTLTTLAMSEYASLSAVWASIWERIRASLSLMTDLDSPATRWSNELSNLYIVEKWWLTSKMQRK